MRAVDLEGIILILIVVISVLTFIGLRRSPLFQSPSKILCDRYKTEVTTSVFDFTKEILSFRKGIFGFETYLNIKLFDEGLYLFKNEYSIVVDRYPYIPLHQALLIPWQDIHSLKTMPSRSFVNKLVLEPNFFSIGTPSLFTVTCSKALFDAISERISGKS